MLKKKKELGTEKTRECTFIPWDYLLSEASIAGRTGQHKKKAWDRFSD